MTQPGEGLGYVWYHAAKPLPEGGAVLVGPVEVEGAKGTSVRTQGAQRIAYGASDVESVTSLRRQCHDPVRAC